MIALLPLLLALLITAPARAEDPLPPCARKCPELAAKGELRAGLSLMACTLRICQEDARQLYGDGRYEEALQALDHIREGRTGMAAYEMERGLVLYALGRMEEAIESFDRVLKQIPTSFRAGSQRAHALSRLGRLEEARAQFEKLLELPGMDREIRQLRGGSYLHGNIGVIELRQGKLAKGKASLARALEEDGSNSLAATMLYKIVPALESASLEPEAIGILEKAYEDLSLGHRSTAMASFASVVERWPRFEIGWWVLGELYFARLDYRSCEDLYARAVRSFPEVADFEVERLRCVLLRHGAASEEGRAAVVELRALAEQHPENRRIKDLFFALDL